MADEEVVRLGANADPFIKVIESAKKSLRSLSKEAVNFKSATVKLDVKGNVIGGKVKQDIDGVVQALTSLRRAKKGGIEKTISLTATKSFEEEARAVEKLTASFVILAKTQGQALQTPTGRSDAIAKQTKDYENFIRVAEKAKNKIGAGTSKIPLVRQPILPIPGATIGSTLIGSDINYATARQREQLEKAERRALELATSLGVENRRLGEITVDAYTRAEISATKYLGKERTLYEAMMKLNTLASELKINPQAPRSKEADKLLAESITPTLRPVDPKRSAAKTAAEAKDHQRSLDTLKSFLIDYNGIIDASAVKSVSEALHLDRARSKIKSELDSVHKEIEQGLDPAFARDRIAKLTFELNALDKVHIKEQLQAELKGLKTALREGLEFNPKQASKALASGLKELPKKYTDVANQVKAVKDSLEAGISTQELKPKIDALSQMVGDLPNSRAKTRLENNLLKIRSRLNESFDSNTVKARIEAINAELSRIGAGVGNLPPHLQRLAALVTELDRVQQALGATTARSKFVPTALRPTEQYLPDPGFRPSPTQKALAQFRQAENAKLAPLDRADLSAQVVLRNAIIEKAFAAHQPLIKANLDKEQFAHQINAYNSNLLSIGNTADRVSLSFKQVEQVFSAIGKNDPSGLILREQQQLYSTILTLNQAYTRLEVAIRKAGEASAKTISKERLDKQQELSVARARTQAERILPRTESLTTPNRGEVEAYSKALARVDDAIRINVRSSKDFNLAVAGLDPTIYSRLPANIRNVTEALKGARAVQEDINNQAKKVEAQRQKEALANRTGLREGFVGSIAARSFPVTTAPIAPQLSERFESAVSKARIAFDSLGISEKRVLEITDALNRKAPLDAFTNAQERKLIDAALKIRNAGRAIENSLRGATKVGTTPDTQARAANAASFISSQTTIPKGASAKEVNAIQNASRAAVISFARGKESLTDFILAFNKISSGVSSFDLLTAASSESYNQLSRLNKALNAAGASYGSAFDKANKSVALAFKETGAGVKDLKVALSSLEQTGFLTALAPGFSKLNQALIDSVTTAKTLGKTNKETRDIIVKAITDQIEAKRREGAEDRKLRQEKQAAATKEAAAQYKAISDRHKSTVDIVNAATPGIRSSPRKIPSQATEAEVNAISAAYDKLVNRIVRGNIEESRFKQILAETRRVQALPPAERIRTPSLPPVERKVRDSILEVDAAYDKVKSTGAKAGQAILISWQGVFRLFQAQTLHTSLAQLIGEFKTAIFEAGKYQTEIALIQTITQETQTSFDQWANSIHRISSELGKPSTEVATAAYDALSNQVTKTKEQTEAFVLTAGQFGRATGTSTVDSVNLLSSAINSFGFASSDAETIASEFFATIDLGRIKGSEIANSFGRTSSLARALGASFREVNAAEIVLTQQGITASEAQTQLNNIFIKLLRPTEATAALFKELGVASGEELVRVRGLGGALQAVAKAAKEGRGDFFEFFNELRGAKGAFALAQDGGKQFEKALKAIEEGVDNYKNALKIIDEPAGVQLSKQLQDVRNYVTDLGASGAASIVNLTQSFGTLRENLERIIEYGTQAAKLFLLGFGVSRIVALTASFGALSGGVVTATGLTAAFSLTMEQATIRLARLKFLATGALFAAGYFAVDYLMSGLDRVETKVKEYRDTVSEAAREAAEAVARASQKEVESTRESLQERERAQLVYYSSVRKQLDKLANVQADISGGIKAAVEGQLSALSTGLKERTEELNKAAEGAKSNIKALRSFVAKSIESGQERDFERQKAAYPRYEATLTDRRAAVLEQQAIKAFDTGNIEEAIRLYEKSDDLITGMGEKFKQFGGLSKGIYDEDILKAFDQVKPVDIASPLHIALDEAIRKYDELASATEVSVEKQGKDYEKLVTDRKAALKEVEKISSQIAQSGVGATSPRVSGDLLGELSTNTSQIAQARQQALAQGYADANISQYINGLLKERFSIFAAIAQKQAERLALIEKERGAELANNKELEINYRNILALANVRKNNKIDPKEAAANLNQAERELGEVTDKLLADLIARREAQIKAGEIPTQSNQQIVDQVNQLRQGLEALIASGRKQIDIELRTEGIDKASASFSEMGKNADKALIEAKQKTDELNKSLIATGITAGALFKTLEESRKEGLFSTSSTEFAESLKKQFVGLETEVSALFAKPITSGKELETIKSKVLQYQNLLKAFDRESASLGEAGVSQTKLELFDPTQISEMKGELARLNVKLFDKEEVANFKANSEKIEELKTKISEPFTTVGKAVENIVSQLKSAEEIQRKNADLSAAIANSHEATRLGRLPVSGAITGERKVSDFITAIKNGSDKETLILTDTLNFLREGNKLNTETRKLTAPVTGERVPIPQEAKIDETKDKAKAILAEIDQLASNAVQIIASTAGTNFDFVISKLDEVIKKYDELSRAKGQLDAADIEGFNKIAEVRNEILRQKKEAAPKPAPPMEYKGLVGESAEGLHRFDQQFKAKVKADPASLESLKTQIQNFFNSLPAFNTNLMMLPLVPEAAANNPIISAEGQFSEALINATKATMSLETGASSAAQALKSINFTPVTASSGGRVGYYAKGGLIPAMLTPGERVFSPEFTKRNYSALVAMNKGTDTVPALLQAGSFVVRHFRGGGMTEGMDSQIRSSFQGIMKPGLNQKSFLNKANNASGVMKDIFRSLFQEVNSLGETLTKSTVAGDGSGTKFNMMEKSAEQSQTMGRKISALGNNLVSAGNTFSKVLDGPNVKEMLVKRFSGGGFVAKGTDTVPAYLRPGSFVLNKRASSRYFASGGFVPNITSERMTNIRSTNSNNPVNIGDININHNVPGSSEASVQRLGQQLQRQIRLGRVNFRG
jgi:TP901 family phage tail tape measure protein